MQEAGDQSETSRDQDCHYRTSSHRDQKPLQPSLRPPWHDFVHTAEPLRSTLQKNPTDYRSRPQFGSAQTVGALHPQPHTSGPSLTSRQPHAIASASRAHRAELDTATSPIQKTP